MSYSEWESVYSHHNSVQVTRDHISSHLISSHGCNICVSFICRCGPLIDLCRGPHVRHTGKIKALKIYKVTRLILVWYDWSHWFVVVKIKEWNIPFTSVQNSSTYWEGRADMETLQRIYGISFPDSKMLKEWERFQEEAKNRDHRKIGKVWVQHH